MQACGVAGGTSIKSIAALRTHQQPLQQTSALGIALRQPAVLTEPLLRQGEDFRSNQSRHGNLDPLAALYRPAGTASSKSSSLTRHSCSLLAGTVLGFA